MNTDTRQKTNALSMLCYYYVGDFINIKQNVKAAYSKIRTY
jgi:hypothetical protein